MPSLPVAEPPPTRRRLARLCGLCALAVLAPRAAAAQAAGTPAPPATPATPATPVTPPARNRVPMPECLGFSFGSWTPPLDARAAGHDPAARSGMPQAPHGRDWAAELPAGGRDTSLVLFPQWWPAGVRIELGAPATPADTIRGTATALVADGRRTAPVAPVLAWGVACQRAAPPR